MQNIDSQQLTGVMTYAEYIQKVKDLVAEDKIATTETKTTPDLIAYTKDNLARMHRLDNHAELSENTLAVLATITEPTVWLNITEGWCGDASQVVPVIEKCAAANPNITHRLIFRDEHLHIMDAFLTAGGRSIPKIVVLDASNNVLGAWGPRPQALQDFVDTERKKMEAMDKEERKEYFKTTVSALHNWYFENNTAAIQGEFSEFLRSVY